MEHVLALGAVGAALSHDLLGKVEVLRVQLNDIVTGLQVLIFGLILFNWLCLRFLFRIRLVKRAVEIFFVNIAVQLVVASDSSQGVRLLCGRFCGRFSTLVRRIGVDFTSVKLPSQTVLRVAQFRIVRRLFPRFKLVDILLASCVIR